MSGAGDLKADLATYTGAQQDAFVIEYTGPRRVALRADNGLYVSATDEGDPLTAEASVITPTEEFEVIRLSNGDLTLRAFGGLGHLPAPAAKDRHSGKLLPDGDNQFDAATNYFFVDGSAPTGPPPPPEEPPRPRLKGRSTERRRRFPG